MKIFTRLVEFKSTRGNRIDPNAPPKESVLNSPLVKALRLYREDPMIFLGYLCDIMSMDSDY